MEVLPFLCEVQRGYFEIVGQFGYNLSQTEERPSIHLLIHVFPAKNLGQIGADSHLSCFPLSCEQLQCVMKITAR